MDYCRLSGLALDHYFCPIVRCVIEHCPVPVHTTAITHTAAITCLALLTYHQARAQTTSVRAVLSTKTGGQSGLSSLSSKIVLL